MDKQENNMPLDLKRFTDEELLNEVKSRMSRLDRYISPDNSLIEKTQHLNPAYELAKEFIGTLEIAGSNSNPEIEQMFKDVVGYTYKDDTAWCAAFVGAMLARTGQPHTGKLNARSYLDWGKPVSKPIEGDIVIFWRESPSSWRGHVGFVKEITPTEVVTLGGNQGNSVNYKSYPRDRVLGYRTYA